MKLTAGQYVIAVRSSKSRSGPVSLIREGKSYVVVDGYTPEHPYVKVRNEYGIGVVYRKSMFKPIQESSL